MKRRSRVGIRALRQHFSVHLEKVVGGATLEVTDRGRSVAILAPLADEQSPLERLRASGRVIAHTEDLVALGRPAGPTSRRGSAAIAAQRADLG
jgi:antitoxin (DNA-binding transcriptional repressor) of toxin-antitoxin stability system